MNIAVVLLLGLLSGCTPRTELTEPIHANVLAKSSSSWEGSPLPNYPQGRPEVTIMKVIVAPGAEFPVHLHPVVTAGILLSGELTVRTESNETLHLKEGDSVVEVVNKWHYGKNEGNQPAEIIVFYAGIVGTPLTIKKE